MEFEKRSNPSGNNICIDERATLIQNDMIHIADDVIVGMYATINASPKIKTTLSKEGIYIGKKSKIGAFSILESVGGYISLGEECSIKEYCLIYGTGGVEIGNYVRIATHVSIIAENHNYDDIHLPIFRQGVSYKGIKIGNDVLIGTRTVILDGVTIEDGCVVGAGSVVTDSIPPNSVVVGNPAKILRERGR
jgi:acetyltransferase-like isoleucine patch superfamily enzyme